MDIPLSQLGEAQAAGNIGFATSGSGDCLAGIIAGIAARGADALQAAAPANGSRPDHSRETVIPYTLVT